MKPLLLALLAASTVPTQTDISIGIVWMFIAGTAFGIALHLAYAIYLNQKRRK